MESKKWLALFNAQPQPVQDYFTSDLSVKNEQAAKHQLAYDDDAWERVMDVVWEVLFMQLPQADFQEKLKRLAGDRKPEDVERAVLLAVILPLADLVYWDVESRLQTLGLALGDIQSVPRVTLRPVSYGAAVRRIASLAKMSLLQEEMVRRVREVLVSYVKGVRTIEQMKELLLRSQAEGGLGYSAQQADVFIGAMNDFMATTQVVSEQEYAEWLNKSAGEQQEALHVSAKSPASADDDSDIRAIASRMPSAGTGPLEESVEAMVKQIALPNLDAYLDKRLRNIISTRLRDVRNVDQVKQILAREVKVGGMELPQEEVERVATAIEQGYQSYREPIHNEEKRQIQETLTQQQGKIEERKKRESEEHAKWYQEKIQAKPEDAFKQQWAQAQPSVQPMQLSGQGKQKGVRAAISPQSAALATGNKPTVDTVQGPLRLMGLEEELAGMTLESFHRLSNNSEEAAKKIVQKVDALKMDSFDRWVGGIEAWRRSPLQQQYLKLVAESFSSGSPVGELVERKRKADASLPTSADIGAIVQLNTQLQY
ncbi:MAG: hypothetical protein Q7R83_01180 [bacterium]|nr:hypothetical protein [bacterium]